uniref:Uncharacterized protein n=1 Tax=Romanomermis culicivorax TaxID=13658 RepID=A0A915IQN5_ROMCU
MWAGPITSVGCVGTRMTKITATTVGGVVIGDGASRMLSPKIGITVCAKSMKGAPLKIKQQLSGAEMAAAEKANTIMDGAETACAEMYQRRTRWH